MNAIGLVLGFDAGSYHLAGQDVSNISEKKRGKYRNQFFGYVVQDFALIPQYSVMENILLPTVISRKKSGVMRKKAISLAERLNVEHLSKQKTVSLSGGEKQRVAICRALINEPDIILADEPAGALDSGNSEIVMGILSELNREGKTVILVTHDTEQAKRCGRILEIKDGQLVNDCVSGSAASCHGTVKDYLSSFLSYSSRTDTGK